jgi:hypothetical protein
MKCTKYSNEDSHKCNITATSGKILQQQTYEKGTKRRQPSMEDYLKIWNEDDHQWENNIKLEVE